MSLSDIKNKLYKKEADDDLAFHDQSEFDARNTLADIKMKKAEETDKWNEEKGELTASHRKGIMVAAVTLGVIIFVVLVLIAVYQIQKASFGPERVMVAVNGPDQAKSGKLLAYEISYNNNNRATLNEAILRITYPESFKPEGSTSYKNESPTTSIVDLGKVSGHASDKIIFSGRIYSPQGTLMYIKADLIYKSSVFNSQFDSKGQVGVNVTSTPIVLEVAAPQNMASGDALDYLISYKNTGEEDFDNIRIKIDYPDGFSFSRSDPASSESNNTWYIGHLSAGAEGKVVISGKLIGDKDEVKNVKAYIGTVDQGGFVSYNEESTGTKIVSSPLAIYQTVNNLASLTANPGDVLRFQIFYKNNGDIGLRDVNVSEKLDSPVLDYSTLDMSGGSYDSQNKTILWKAVDYPDLANLAPGKEGTIRFSIKVKDVIPITNANDKNFVITSLAKIDSPDIPTPLEMNKVISGNEMDIKLNSKLALDVKGFYKDAIISNAGPIPPVAGQATTYAIHWSALNVSNDIADAKVEATLPTGVVLTGVIYPQDAKVTYNERNNTVVWDIGNMKAGDGILNSAKGVVFQIKYIPSPNQSNSFADLVSESAFTATDLFTGENLSAKGEKKNTMLREDPTVGADGGKVR